MAGTLRVLLIGPRPRDLGSLSTKDEIRGIVFRVSQLGLQLELIEHLGTEFNDLPGLLFKHDPDVLHITAHGSKEGFLAFEDRHGARHDVRIESLRMLLRAHMTRGKLRCVVFNSCEMAEQVSTLTELIPHIVASPNSLLMKAAIAFSEIFYQMLAAGNSVEFAFAMAHSASHACGGESGTYELYPRLPSGGSTGSSSNQGGGQNPSPWSGINVNVNVNINVYINAVSADGKYLNELKVFLQPLSAPGKFKVWDRSMISFGMDRDEESRRVLEAANLVLLFVSAKALADDKWIADMKQAMNQQKRGAIRVVPILVRPVLIEGTDFANMQSLPRSPKAVSALSQNERDELWREIAAMIMNLMKGSARN